LRIIFRGFFFFKVPEKKDIKINIKRKNLILLFALERTRTSTQKAVDFESTMSTIPSPGLSN